MVEMTYRMSLWDTNHGGFLTVSMVIVNGRLGSCETSHA